MRCTICKLPNHSSTIVDYARTRSLRKTAALYGVGYRSLHRHFSGCVFSVMALADEQRFEDTLTKVAAILRTDFRLQRKPRPRSILKKSHEVNWGRRSWKRKNTVNL